MARSRGGSRPATRGGFGGSRSPFGSTQTRSASTVAAPAPAPAPAAPHPVATPAAQPHAQPAPAAVAQPQQPGLFAQMASTAAGVAVGSAVGHTIGAGISSIFSGSGSSSSAPAEQQQQQQQQALATPQVQATQMNPEMAKTCDADARNFTRCLEENNGNFQICDYYLQQLKACQEAARQY